MPTFNWSGRRIALLSSAIPLIALLTGCEDVPTGAVSVTIPSAPVQNVAVTTFFDPSFNFTALRTFAMPDTVMHLSPVIGTPTPVSRQNDNTVLNQVRQNFLARGYTEITNPRSVRPDFMVLVGATAVQNHVAFVSYSWFSTWGFYEGWNSVSSAFDQTWGIIYPWASVSGVRSYERGTIIVDLIPVLMVQPLDRSIRAAWSGVAAAILNGSVPPSAIDNAIDEMFRQSPYLRSGF